MYYILKYALYIKWIILILNIYLQFILQLFYKNKASKRKVVQFSGKEIK